MRITSVEVTPFSDRGHSAPLLVLRTDSALSGIGEIFVRGQLEPFEPAAATLSTLLVGRDPFDLQALTSDAGSRAGATLFESALAAAAGTAMADICGQDLGVPIHQLLGGRVRDRVRACAVDWAEGAVAIREVAAAAVRTAGLGFTALRVEPFATRVDRGSTRLASAVAFVQAVRDDLPAEIDLVVDGGGAPGVEDAAAFAEALVPLEPLWLEQAAPDSGFEAIQHLADHYTLPLASGRGTGPDILLALMTGMLVDHVVLEIGRVGGLLEARRIAALAEIYHIGIIPTGTAPVSMATALHLAASIPNLTMIELRPGLVTVEDGTVAVDLTPGLGIDAGLATTMEVA